MGGGVNASANSSGLFYGNPQEIKEKQQSTQKILEDIKKFLDKNELPKLLSVFKEVKECERMEPVFKKLRTIFFGNIVAPTKLTDRYFAQKMQCLSDLGSLIPRRKQEEYRVLL